MRILLSNDDGIQAPGIHALRGAVQDLGEIHVVAPVRPGEAFDLGPGVVLHSVARRRGLAGRLWTVLAAAAKVVRLKPDLVFHNGKTVTADDVVSSYRRILDPKTRAAGVDLLFLPEAGFPLR